jgi:hypothetical protein
VDTTLNSIVFDYDLGRSFIAAPPALTPYQFAELGGFKETMPERPELNDFAKLSGKQSTIDLTRQFVEVLLALLFTFGVMWALRLKKPTGD